MSTLKERILEAHQKEPLLKISALANKYKFNINYTRKVIWMDNNGVTPELKSINTDSHSLTNKVYRAIKNRRCDIIQLANKFKVPPIKIEQAIDELKENHRCIDNFSDGTIQMATTSPFVPDEETVVIDTIGSNEKEFCFGAIADMHIGSKYERVDVLTDLYDRFEQAGAKTVYIAGNWIDGERRFNKNDIYVHGVEDQIDNFIKKMPYKKGITNLILSGDDHEGWYVQDQHINIGKYMQLKAHDAGRTDLIDIGYMEANIKFEQELGSATLRVHHPGAGSGYALSYKSQKYVESLQGGERPQIVLTGHYHKYDYCYPREVHAIQVGCLQDQTPFMRKRNLASHLGGCLVYVKQNQLGIITSIKVEWMPYYDKKFYTYFWKQNNSEA